VPSGERQPRQLLPPSGNGGAERSGDGGKGCHPGGRAGAPSAYGYRRVTADLRRRGLVVNHKGVLRIMKEDNLLAIRYRKYILTSASQHDCRVYLNLAARLTLTGVNQLWVADITYIRLRTEFVSWRW
jgi:transposase InsO family protein